MILKSQDTVRKITTNLKVETNLQNTRGTISLERDPEMLNVLSKTFINFLSN